MWSLIQHLYWAAYKMVPGQWSYVSFKLSHQYANMNRPCGLTCSSYTSCLISWHGNHITGPLCGEFWWISITRNQLCMQNLEVFFVVHLNMLLKKQSGCKCFETQYRLQLEMFLDFLVYDRKIIISLVCVCFVKKKKRLLEFCLQIKV